MIIQRVLPHYRVPFFERLSLKLAENGLELRLLYGDEYPGTVPRTVLTDAPWAVHVRNTYIRFLRRELVWQGRDAVTQIADLIIVEQARRLLINYLLAARRMVGGPTLAFWGHGSNRDEPGSGGDAISRFLARRADHWFAYTRDSLPDLHALRVHPDRITVVNNAIDTEALIRGAAAWSPAALDEFRAEYDLPRHGVGLYCGSFSYGKRIPFLLEAAETIRRHVPDFHLLLVGDGPDLEPVRHAARVHSWIHYAGARFGTDRVPYFLVSDLVLAPGALGLNILDALALTVPLITTSGSAHGPEVAYLADGRTGLATGDTVDDFSMSVVALLKDQKRLDFMREECRTIRQHYTIDRMVSCFYEGVQASLRRVPR